jgi:hypothetical protein
MTVGLICKPEKPQCLRRHALDCDECFALICIFAFIKNNVGRAFDEFGFLPPAVLDGYGHKTRGIIEGYFGGSCIAVYIYTGFSGRNHQRSLGRVAHERTVGLSLRVIAQSPA